MRDPFVWATIILGIWAALGPLVGVRYGNELTTRSQKRHWTSDNVKQECRELISAMANTFTIFIPYYAKTSLGFSGPHDEGETRAMRQAHKESLEIFYRMFFIWDDLLMLNTRDRWMAATSTYEHDGDIAKFASEFGTLVREVREIARRFTK